MYGCKHCELQTCFHVFSLLSRIFLKSDQFEGFLQRGFISSSVSSFCTWGEGSDQVNSLAPYFRHLETFLSMCKKSLPSNDYHTLWWRYFGFLRGGWACLWGACLSFKWLNHHHGQHTYSCLFPQLGGMFWVWMIFGKTYINNYTCSFTYVSTFISHVSSPCKHHCLLHSLSSKTQLQWGAVPPAPLPKVGRALWPRWGNFLS